MSLVLKYREEVKAFCGRYHKSEMTFVYLIKVEENIYKLGKSKNYKQRFDAHNTSNHKELEDFLLIRTDVYSDLEDFLKKEFIALNIKGEFFNFSVSDIELLKEKSILFDDCADIIDNPDLIYAFRNSIRKNKYFLKEEIERVYRKGSYRSVKILGVDARKEYVTKLFLETLAERYSSVFGLSCKVIKYNMIFIGNKCTIKFENSSTYYKKAKIKRYNDKVNSWTISDNKKGFWAIVDDFMDSENPCISDPYFYDKISESERLPYF